MSSTGLFMGSGVKLEFRRESTDFLFEAGLKANKIKKNF